MVAMPQKMRFQADRESMIALMVFYVSTRCRRWDIVEDENGEHCRQLINYIK
jgi:hypothetical protein